MKLFFQLIVVAVLGISTMEGSAQNKVLLKGVVKDRPGSDTLLLSAVTTSIRDDEKIIAIPIKDGKFEYSLNAAQVEAYQLVFLDEMEAGGWRPVIFFSDSAVIALTLYPMDLFEDNVIIGGKVNRDYIDIQRKLTDRFKDDYEELGKKRKALNDAENYRSKEHAAVIAKLMKAATQDEKRPIYEELDGLRKTGAEYTEPGRALNEQYDSVSREMAKLKYALINKEASLDAYYLLWRDAVNYAKSNRNIAEYVQRTFPAYAAKFPTHPYTDLIKKVINGVVKVVPGNQYVDFTAPTLAGKEMRLSAQIQGKLAVIDLWASWCGPCIAKAKALVPIYNKYKNKGFTIVGIAREFKSLDALKSRLSKEAFSWQHLVELDDKNGIWNKYAVGDGGGLQVLVDQQGTILAINPSTAEVEMYIKKLLKI